MIHDSSYWKKDLYNNYEVIANFIFLKKSNLTTKNKN